MPTLIIVPLEATRARAYDVKRIKANLMKALSEAADDFEKDYKGVTDSFTHKVTYKKKTGMKGGDGFGRVTSDDDILRFLEFGTSHRWAVMDQRFVPKTSTRSLSAGAGAYPQPRYKGQGQVLGAGYPGPKPGISPRRFGESIKSKRLVSFWRKVQSALGPFV